VQRVARSAQHLVPHESILKNYPHLLKVLGKCFNL
jgi:hypothetical protein